MSVSPDALIPPPEINYNQSAAESLEAYVREFKQGACLRELPFLMRRAGLTPQSQMLDYGCGLGRLAYAASKYLEQNGAYYGFEPNQEALRFLRTAYRDHRNFSFRGVELRIEEDYVALGQGATRDTGAAGTDVDLTTWIDARLDVQWSSSVFTHMWRDPIVHVLRSISALMKPVGMCVNTWLIVDDFAAYALRCDLADRRLPLRVNGALTYSRDNPLVCTAYELDMVRGIYRDAGHEVLDILWGSWSGRDNDVIYQDIVLSRPVTR